ncbi:MAG TPA: Ig-like domain-containing protein [Gemmatimonadales bacterium]|nr:Ig-like domain-containing protein [Gemmatimonadales bacterium]
MRVTAAPLLAVLMLCGCTAEPLGPPNLVPVATVTVAPASPVVSVGAKAPLTPIPLATNGDTLSNRTFTWASGDAAIASVDAQGVVTGVAAGSTQITATAEAKSGSVTLTVSTTAVNSVTVTPTTTTVDVGGTATLTGAAFATGGAPLPGRVFSWASSNTSVAAVTSLGVVHGIAPGTATITGTSEGKSATATVTVVIAPVASVTITPVPATVGIGETLQLTATLKDAGGHPLSGRTVTWQTSNQLVVSISNTGLATGVSLGDVTITATAEGVNGTATIGGRLRFTSVSAGQDFTCGVTPLHSAYCWGRNAAGALGNGTPNNSTTPVAVSLPVGVRLDSVSAGQDHACGLTTTGNIYCWGANDFGQLGTGNTNPRTAPTLVSVSPPATFTQVSAAAQFTCALTTTNLALCWGLNFNGQLGNAINVNTNTPNSSPLVVNGGPFRAVSATQGHACALLTGGAGQDGLGVCWGLNDQGQLGRGGGNSPPFDVNPQVISGFVQYATIAAGVRFSCGIELTVAGAADCWGLNDVGQLGTTTLGGFTSSPVSVTGGLVFAQLSAGNGLACGVTSNGQGYCWGNNSFGQLGIGSTVAVPTPPQPRLVSGGLALGMIAAGYFHACGVTTTRAAWCWGRAQDGLNPTASALGNGASGGSNTPVQVSGQQ